ncbi:hypothetical protein [Methylomonas fluvii]|uniref:Uncharacterized protein n=1 Tax=Methylomonas fluvii TaxID=1854564 RepID=A0ABR9DBS1_9GAMM|nr:hypothetical protein [Methylomonas fluvii]MBD9360560.1 hypothetical protein [Methylomonas fluvii]CAD6873392.1 hypothetical protein [Methylomonas fluvii]
MDLPLSNPPQTTLQKLAWLAFCRSAPVPWRGQWDGDEIDEKWACPRLRPDAVSAGRQAWSLFQSGLAQLPLRQRILLLKCRID